MRGDRSQTCHMLSAKQESIWYHFYNVIGMTRSGSNPRPPAHNNWATAASNKPTYVSACCVLRKIIVLGYIPNLSAFTSIKCLHYSCAYHTLKVHYSYIIQMLLICHLYVCNGLWSGEVLNLKSCAYKVFIWISNTYAIVWLHL